MFTPRTLGSIRPDFKHSSLLSLIHISRAYRGCFWKSADQCSLYPADRYPSSGFFVPAWLRHCFKKVLPRRPKTDCDAAPDVYKRQILDPRIGYPADTGLSSVTLLSASSTDRDALSTSCFLLGYEKGRELIDSLPDIEALFLLSDGTIYRTEGFPQS